MPMRGVMSDQSNKDAYWKSNLTYVGILLTIWFIVSYGCGILFVDQLNTIKVAGFKLGFWFAQQGSIFVFVILIFVYKVLMDRLDKKYGFEEEDAITEDDKKHAKEGDDEWEV
jgi:putative solute:sodium symporter small subunit